MVLSVLNGVVRSYKITMEACSPVKKGNATKTIYEVFSESKRITDLAQWGISELKQGSDFGIVERVLLKEGIISKYGQDEGVFYGA